MNDEFLYIRELETDQLIDIISNIWGFEETSRALLELEEREPQKALELGIDMIENDKGDDYLQATTWDIIFEIAPNEVLDCLCRRNTVIGKVLLYDILRDLNSGYYIKDLKKIPIAFVNKVTHTYDLLEENYKIELSEEFNEFMEKSTVYNESKDV